MRKEVWMMVVGVSCCCAGPDAEAGWGADIALTNEAAFFAEIDLTRVELAEVRAAVEQSNWLAAKEAWGAYLETHVAPRWMWTYRDRDRIRDFLKSRDAWEGQFDGSEGVLGEIRDWIAENPCTPIDNRGAWHRLEVSKRLGGGLLGTPWFDIMNRHMGAPAFDAELRYQMSRSLFEHARWMYRNPRNQVYKGTNIQTSMCSALATAAMMFPEARESGAWWDLALARLGEYMERGIYPDGAYEELAPGYHWHVTRQFFHLVLLARKNNRELPESFGRHEKMYEFMIHLTKPDRTMANISDAVWARISDPAKPLTANHRFGWAMATGALLYDRADMRWFGPDEVPVELVWRFSEEDLARYATMPKENPGIRSHLMPYTQFGVMRTGWARGDRWLLIDYSVRGGPHTHWDKLQVKLYSAGRDLLLDPGTCGYKDADRPYYISHEAHNILLVNGKGIGRYASPEVLAWGIRPQAEFAAGRTPLQGIDCVQQRSVLFVKPDYWVVVDHVSGTPETPEITRFFHLPPGAVQQDGNTVRTTFDAGDNLWLHVADDSSLAMREGLVAADSAGNRNVKAPVAVYTAQTSLPAALCTVLVPFAHGQEIPTVKRLTTTDNETIALGVEFRDGRRDWLAVAPGVRELRVGPFTGTGMAMCVRTDAQGNETAFEVFEGIVESK